MPPMHPFPTGGDGTSSPHPLGWVHVLLPTVLELESEEHAPPVPREGSTAACLPVCRHIPSLAGVVFQLLSFIPSDGITSQSHF